MLSLQPRKKGSSMDIFSLCTKVFRQLAAGKTLPTEDASYGNAYMAYLGAQRFMTVIEENTVHDGRITLLSIYLFDGKKHSTIVVADKPYGNSDGQVAGGDIRQVLALLLNNGLASDADVRACVAHHQLTAA